MNEGQVEERKRETERDRVSEEKKDIVDKVLQNVTINLIRKIQTELGGF